MLISLPLLPYNLAQDHQNTEFSDGLRLSIECPAERIKRYYNCDDRFDNGVSKRGHELADEFIRTVFKDTSRVTIEEEVPWLDNRCTAHVDCLVDDKDSQYYGPWEIKSHVDSTSPTSKEVSQLKRYLWALHRSDQHNHYPYGYIAIINPSNLRIFGPFKVCLTNADILRYDREEQLTKEILSNKSDNKEWITELCTCGLCALDEITDYDIDLSPDLSKLSFEYKALKLEGADKKELDHVRKQFEEILPFGSSAKSTRIGITVSRSRPTVTKTINWNAALEAGIIPPSLVNELDNNGYVSKKVNKGTLRIKV